MSSLIVGFLVRLFDIPAAVVGLTGGWFSRNWVHLLIIAFIGGSIGEVVLYYFEDARAFNVVKWLVGVAACFAWAALAFGIRAILRRAR